VICAKNVGQGLQTEQKVVAQNRRQKGLNRGRGLYVCARGLDILKIDKNSTDL